MLRNKKWQLLNRYKLIVWGRGRSGKCHAPPPPFTHQATNVQSLIVVSCRGNSSEKLINVRWVCMVEMTLRCGERNSNGTRTLIFPQAFAVGLHLHQIWVPFWKKSNEKMICVEAVACVFFLSLRAATNHIARRVPPMELMARGLILTYWCHKQRWITMSQDNPPHGHYSHSVNWSNGTSRNLGIHYTTSVLY